MQKQKPRKYRGNPVKPQRPARPNPGAPRLYPDDHTAVLYLRCTPADKELWRRAAEVHGKLLGLPEGNRISVNTFARMSLNLTAEQLIAKGFGLRDELLDAKREQLIASVDPSGRKS